MNFNFRSRLALGAGSSVHVVYLNVRNMHCFLFVGTNVGWTGYYFLLKNLFTLKANRYLIINMTTNLSIL